MGYTPWGHRESDITEQQQQYHQKKFNLYLHKKWFFFRMEVQLIAKHHYLSEVVNSFAKNSPRGKISLFSLTTTSKFPQNLKDKLSYTYKCSTGFSSLLTPSIEPLSGDCQVPMLTSAPWTSTGCCSLGCHAVTTGASSAKTASVSTLPGVSWPSTTFMHQPPEELQQPMCPGPTS